MRNSTLAALPLFVAIITTSTSLAQQPTLDVQAESVAQTEGGQSVQQFTLTNSRGMKATVINFGATLTGLYAPDRNGTIKNITLHFDDPARYLQGHPLFGSVVGRYANRIAQARFVIDGTTYQLEKNAGENHIHGGREGFQRVLWDAQPLRFDDRVGVELTHTSPDGHAGYPGRLQAKVHYLLTDDNQLVLEYWATSDKPTHVNLTNHAYWNLGGIEAGNILDHVMTISADQYLEANTARFPSGRLLDVADSPLDFRTPRVIGARVEQLEIKNYDDCYVIRKSDGPLPLAARALDPRSGRVMEVRTTAPGVQFYTARGLGGSLGAGGVSYGPYYGFCLETQAFPDSPNQPTFPSTLLRPGQTYHQKTVHTFSVQD